MKHLKRFNELKKYSEQELSDKSIENHVNLKTVIKHLISEWNFPEDVITAVVVAFGGSYDQSNEYLNDMDGFGYDNPADYWPEFCDNNRIEHEVENNPFI